MAESVQLKSFSSSIMPSPSSQRMSSESKYHGVFDMAHSRVTNEIVRVNAGSVRALPTSQKSHMSCMVCHSDSLLVCGYDDGTVVVCVGDTTKRSTTIHKNSVDCVGVGVGYVVTVSTDCAVISSVEDDNNDVVVPLDCVKACVSSDGKLLAALDDHEGVVSVWSTTANGAEPMDEIRLSEVGERASDVACNSECVVVVVDERAFVYNTRENNVVNRVPLNDGKRATSVLVTPDVGSRQMVAVHTNGEWSVFSRDENEYQPLFTRDGGDRAQFSTEGIARLTICTNDGVLYVYDVLTGECLQHAVDTNADAWCLYNRCLVVYTDNQLTTYECLYPGEVCWPGVSSMVVLDHNATNTDDFGVILRYEDGHVVRTGWTDHNDDDSVFSLPEGSASQVLVTQNGRLACATSDSIVLYDADSGVELCRCDDLGLREPVFMCESSDKSYIVVACENRWLLCDPQDARLVQSGDGEFLAAHKSYVCHSERIVSVPQGREIVELHSLMRDEKYLTYERVMNAAFSRDGKRLVAQLTPQLIVVLGISGGVLLTLKAPSSVRFVMPMFFASHDERIILGVSSGGLMVFNSYSGSTLMKPPSIPNNPRAYTLRGGAFDGALLTMRAQQHNNESGGYFVLVHGDCGCVVRSQTHITNCVRSYMDGLGYANMFPMIAGHAAAGVRLCYSFLFRATQYTHLELVQRLTLFNNDNNNSSMPAYDPLWTPSPPFVVCNQHCSSMALAVALRCNSVGFYINQIIEHNYTAQQYASLFVPWHFGRILTRARQNKEVLVGKGRKRRKGQETTWRILCSEYPQGVLELLRKHSFPVHRFVALPCRAYVFTVPVGMLSEEGVLLHGSADVVVKRTFWSDVIQDTNVDSDVVVRVEHSVAGVPLSGWLRGSTHATYMRHHPIGALIREGLMDAFDVPLVRKAVDYKWNKFARKFFLTKFYLYLVFLACFTIATIEYRDHSYASDFRTYVRVALEGVVCAFAVYYFVGECQQLRRYRLRTYLTDMWNYIDLACCVCIFVLVPLHIFEWRARFAVQSVGAIVLWVKVLHFARAFFSTGPFIKMIVKIARGIGAFLLILCVSLVGFGHAFFLLYVESDLASEYSSWTVMLKVYQLLLGDFEMEEIRAASYPGVSVLLFVLFTVFVAILMLNLLIALMSHIYEDVQSRVEAEWYMERAELIMEIERSIANTDNDDETRHKYFPPFLHKIERVRDIKSVDITNGVLADRIDTLQNEFQQFRQRMQEEFSVLDQRAARQVTMMNSILSAVEA